jgi:hypothetical protein
LQSIKRVTPLSQLCQLLSLYFLFFSGNATTAIEGAARFEGRPLRLLIVIAAMTASAIFGSPCEPQKIKPRHAASSIAALVDADIMAAPVLPPTAAANKSNAHFRRCAGIFPGRDVGRLGADRRVGQGTRLVDGSEPLRLRRAGAERQDWGNAN